MMKGKVGDDETGKIGDEERKGWRGRKGKLERKKGKVGEGKRNGWR